MNTSVRKNASSKRALAAFVFFVLAVSSPVSSLAQVKARSSASKAAGRAKTLLKAGRYVRSDRKTDDDGQIYGERYIGEPGITESVAAIMRREANTPRKPFDPSFVEAEEEHREHHPKKTQPADALFVSRFPYGGPAESVLGALAPQTVGTSIAGPGRNADAIGAVPPDSVGDVGPTQVIMHANGRVKVYDKATGAVGGLDVADSTFWSSVSNGAGVSDPRVEYDRLSQRWFLCMINIAATQNRIMLAVSSGPTITNASSFTFFQITTPNQFLDYPTLGVDANALYIGGNIFTSSSGTFSRTDAYVVNKANLLAGSLSANYFAGLLPNGSSAGPWTPQGVSNDDPAATEGYFIGVDNAAFSLLQIRRVSSPGSATPTLSANIGVSVPATAFPMGGVSYQGVASNRTLDDLDDRLFQAQIVRDNVTGVSQLWTAHNIEVDAGGVANSAGNRNAARWYEIGNLTTTPALTQSGTLFDGAGTNQNSFWIPSVAVSGQGHAALGASSAGAARFPSLYSAGRLRTDSPGTIQAPTQTQASSTAYNLEGANVKQRWGDYSKMTVDPCDNQSMWHVGEYCDAANSWRMRAVKLVAPPPPATVTASPSTLANVFAGYNVVVTGVSSGGTEFYDNPAGFACSPSCSTTGTGNCHIAASVTSSPGTPVTVNSVTFNSPTQVTINFNTASASTGTHAIRITNPDGQTTSFNLQVLAPTAAGVPVSGRVVTSSGIGIRGAVVTLTDLNGQSRIAFTNLFGFYRFDDVEAGQTYFVTAAAKRYSFESRIVSVGDELTGMDFVAR